MVELFSKTGTKTERDVNIIKSHTVLCPFIKQTVDAIHMRIHGCILLLMSCMLLVEPLHDLTGEPTYCTNRTKKISSHL